MPRLKKLAQKLVNAYVAISCIFWIGFFLYVFSGAFLYLPKPQIHILFWVWGITAPGGIAGLVMMAPYNEM